jgi:hypothetical protein
MVISLRSSYFLLIIKGNFNLFLETKKFRYPKNSGCPSERVSHLLLIWRLFKRVLYRLGWLILFMKVDIFVSSVLISNVLRNHLNLSSRIVLRSFEEQENCASFSVLRVRGFYFEVLSIQLRDCLAGGYIDPLRRLMLQRYL